VDLASLREGMEEERSSEDDDEVGAVEIGSDIKGFGGKLVDLALEVVDVVSLKDGDDEKTGNEEAEVVLVGV